MDNVRRNKGQALLFNLIHRYTMKRSTIFHTLGRIAGVIGTLALIGAWLAGEQGTFWGFSQTHLFNDAIVITLLSISALVCGMFYFMLEKKQ